MGKCLDKCNGYNAYGSNITITNQIKKRLFCRKSKIH